MYLSIITVTWNSEQHISEQIRSVISGCAGISFEQLVVDNGSSDRTVEIIKKDFPEIQLIANNQNQGFSAANNQAAERASGKYLLFLNADMKVGEGSLSKLVAWMDEHPDVGIVGPKLTDEQGQLNLNALPRRFPTLLNQLAIILKIPHLFPRVLNHYLYHDLDFTKEQEVDSVRGSCMLVRREIIKSLGWAFDPRYFIWFEDVDLCREATKLKWKVMYTPVVSCVDLVGTSFKKRNFWWKQFQLIRSMITYFWKWGI